MLSGALLPAARVLWQICTASPAAYLADSDTVSTLATALLSFLQPSEAADQEAASREGARALALEAAAHLLSRAEERVAKPVQPRLLVRGVSILKTATTGALPYLAACLHDGADAHLVDPVSWHAASSCVARTGYPCTSAGNAGFTSCRLLFKLSPSRKGDTDRINCCRRDVCSSFQLPPGSCKSCSTEH